jgi:hypothetical protein
MLSSVEAWWAGLCALPFDGAQGDSPPFRVFQPTILPFYFSRTHRNYIIKSPVAQVTGLFKYDNIRKIIRLTIILLGLPVIVLHVPGSLPIRGHQ